eukprot:CAMPEP_0119004998 /NCGR_PEP_ID=MMETSP1176-20130426/1471_1 /TAXON_ID=265551 /ORGANISM="Synedropsis recta cf, Strain CCMP1620" /LENGTH=482 /DNA_ID=CAMNT_0006956761 /DNA_START=230 /DNA_END=1678 /DNA_ORIENTATION=-
MKTTIAFLSTMMLVGATTAFNSTSTSTINSNSNSISNNNNNTRNSQTRFEANSAIICGLSEDRAVSCAPRMLTTTSSSMNDNQNGDNDSSSTQTESAAAMITTVPFPQMPAKIHALIHKDWNVLDPHGEQMMQSLKGIDAAIEFAHSRSTFYEHLQGTFGILAAWDQPEVVRRTGLVHTAYSGDLFQFYLFDATSDSDRSDLRAILGEPAEALTHLFGTVNRGGLCDFASVVNQTQIHAKRITGPQTVHHRVYGEWAMSETDAANILLVTIADYLDQMVETNGWRDHHQIEEGATVLYPGDGKPAVGFYWFSAVCHTVKEWLQVVPPIFNDCTTIMSIEDETKGRDAYWNVVQHEKSLSEDEQVVLLTDAIKYNPFVAEPHIMLSQIFYRQDHYYQAAVEARAALEKLYVLASAWDKRRAFEYWVGFSRILLLKANRKLEENPCILPCSADANDPLYINYQGLKLTPLRDMVQEMKDREEQY